MTAERRAHGAQNALEETKTMLEQADRSRRQAEQDLADSHENLADLTVQNQGFVSAKRKLESDLADLRGEAEEAKGEAVMADDRAKKFMMDAARSINLFVEHQLGSMQLTKLRCQLSRWGLGHGCH